ncbi:MAG: UDP-N-acetylmuramoyl-L-alanine--D-glutamate ligase [Gemmatimonas sp.]|nr:UDP-N-acetylmuramoyl-L-alanine--D-glutamate ligase [Gemmatimonas sp.]
MAREQGDHPLLDSGDRVRDGRLRNAQDTVSGSPVTEMIGVLGLARSGMAASRLALSRGASVYASDVSSAPAAVEAAAKLRELGVEVDVGGHDVAKLARCSRIVLSPGIPPGAPILQVPELAEIPIVPELEYAYEALTGPVVAVTGTNGKTTVTALITHVLRVAGRRAESGGNIGTALSELALRDSQPEVSVVEASSFQLGRTRDFAPSIGVLTNLAPDHLDWYATVAEYYADKAKLFQNSTEESRWVLNGEDEESYRLAEEAKGTRYCFRAESHPAQGELGGYLSEDGWLTLRLEAGEDRIVAASALQILGAHNIANSLAAAIVARLLGSAIEGIAAGLTSFQPMKHRVEPVGEHGGVLWVNDSKATNIASTRVGIRSLDRPTILLLGGRHKGEAYAELIPDLKGRVRQVIAFGEAALQIEEALGGAVPVERIDGDFATVLRRASHLARPGDAVLLSPACSSYDMFRDYEDRGQQFRRIVTEELG